MLHYILNEVHAWIIRKRNKTKNTEHKFVGDGDLRFAGPFVQNWFSEKYGKCARSTVGNRELAVFLEAANCVNNSQLLEKRPFLAPEQQRKRIVAIFFGKTASARGGAKRKTDD